MARPKYGNRKTVMFGIKFDSKREAHRYAELRQMETRGEISGLERQVPFELQGRDGPILTPTGRRMKYVADFVYTKAGARVVEDSKGYPTPEYKLKKAILLAQGVVIVES